MVQKYFRKKLNMCSSKANKLIQKLFWQKNKDEREIKRHFKDEMKKKNPNKQPFIFVHEFRKSRDRKNKIQWKEVSL